MSDNLIINKFTELKNSSNEKINKIVEIVESNGTELEKLTKILEIEKTVNPEAGYKNMENFLSSNSAFYAGTVVAVSAILKYEKENKCKILEKSLEDTKTILEKFSKDTKKIFRSKESGHESIKLIDDINKEILSKYDIEFNSIEEDYSKRFDKIVSKLGFIIRAIKSKESITLEEEKTNKITV